MTTQSNKHIFVDLDETLIHSWTKNSIDAFYSGERTIKKIIIGAKNEEYSVQLRPNSVEFLNSLRKITSNVFMLTIATKDYAVAMNREFGLGFPSSSIYSREHIQKNLVPEVGVGSIYLIDNLKKQENRNKAIYLRPLGELTYIQVPEYIGGADEFNGYSPDLINKIVNQIKKS